MRTLPLDPSLTGGRMGAKAGFDLTWRSARERDLKHASPRRRVCRASLSLGRGALADGPKQFEELMAAVGSRDGREIVRELEVLRSRDALHRDGEGRYLIGSKSS